MSYQHEHIPFVEPTDGYNQVAELYPDYHKKLTLWDEGAVMKYLPRSLQGVHVLDLGGGDGRWATLLQGKGTASRTIVDSAQSMLDRAPAWTQKVHADLRESLPVPSATYQLIFAVFVLLHLDTLSSVFAEARRCIHSSGRMLIVHHHERRPFVHHTAHGPLKIKTRHRRFEEVESELRAAGRAVDVFPVDEVTKIFCCFPI